MTINAPMATMQTLTDSFFDATWEGITVTAHTGTDNRPGATRSFDSGGVLPSTEQLSSYTDNSPNSIDRLWIGIGGATPSDPLPISVTADEFVDSARAAHRY
ncbi:hypothetical protein HWV62_19989 [Athelia sp. TMB]|nr:hypothetical protein HWV62_19989 [Athelia sp. TMB]